MAAVFCASLRRRAMVWRSLVIRTRSSRAASDGGEAWRGAGGVGAGAGRAAAGAAGADEAAMTSPFSTWPRLPEPSTPARSMPRSAAILAADGAGGMEVGPDPAAGAAAPLEVAAAAGAGGGRAGRRDLAQHGAGGDGGAGLDADGGEHARRRGVDLERDLVGLELAEGLVGLHGVAGLLEPLGHGGLADRLAQCRHLDVRAAPRRRRDGRRLRGRVGMVAVTRAGLDALHGGSRGGGLRGFGSGRLCLGGRGGAGSAGRDLTQDGAGHDGLAVLDGDLAQDARRGRIDLQGDLVGLEFADGLVGLDGVARLLEPAADRGLADRFAEGGNANLSRHGRDAPIVRRRGARALTSGPRPMAADLVVRCFTGPTSPRGSRPENPRGRSRAFARHHPAKASSMKALSWARCFDIRPVAVAAAAGRPA